MYRIKEINAIYECGWIYVSNILHSRKIVEAYCRLFSENSKHKYKIVKL